MNTQKLNVWPITLALLFACPLWANVTGSQLIANTSINASPADFSLAASPANLSINNQDVGSTHIAVIPLDGFSGSVNLTASGLPNGVKAFFFNNPTATGSELELNVRFAKPGTYTITITGTSGNLISTVPITLTVNGPGQCGVVAC